MEETNPNLGVGGIGMHQAGSGTAAAMLKELQGLSINVVAGATAGTKMDVAALREEDTIVAALVEDTTSGVTEADDAANITIQSVKAAGTITISSTGPLPDEEVVVNGKTYTFKAAATKNSEVTIGGTINDTAENLKNRINLVEGLGVAAVTATRLNAVVTVTAVADGVGGNAITLTESATNVAVSGSGTLENGTATGGIKSSTNLTGKALLLFWLNKK